MTRFRACSQGLCSHLKLDCVYRASSACPPRSAGASGPSKVSAFFCAMKKEEEEEKKASLRIIHTLGSTQHV